MPAAVRVKTKSSRLNSACLESTVSVVSQLDWTPQVIKVWDYGMSLNKLTDYSLSARPILVSYSGVLFEADCGRLVRAADSAAPLQGLQAFLTCRRRT